MGIKKFNNKNDKHNIESFKAAMEENEFKELKKSNQNHVSVSDLASSDLLKSVGEKLKSALEEGTQIGISINSSASKIESPKIIKLIEDMENNSKEIKATLEEICSSLKQVLKNQEDEIADLKWIIKKREKFRYSHRKITKRKKMPISPTITHTPSLSRRKVFSQRTMGKVKKISSRMKF